MTEWKLSMFFSMFALIAFHEYLLPTNEKSVLFKTPFVLGLLNDLIEGLAEGCLKIVCDRRNYKTLYTRRYSYLL